jgi:hypothetical protein
VAQDYLLIGSVQVQSSDGHGATTAPVDWTPANLLVAVVADHVTVAAAALTDSYHNTWVDLPEQSYAPSEGRGRLVYAKQAVSGPNHTFTIGVVGTGAITAPNLIVYAFSGAPDDPFESDSGTPGAQYGSNVTALPLTPINDGSLIFFGATIGGGTGGTPSIDQGFTDLTLADGTVNSYGAAAAYLIQTTAAEVAPKVVAENRFFNTALLAVFAPDLSADEVVVAGDITDGPPNPQGPQGLSLGQSITLLPSLTISDAIASTVTTPVLLLVGMQYLVVEALFVRASGGTSVDAYVQTSIDGGATWVDIANFHFTTSTATKVAVIARNIALAAAITPTDGSLAANSKVDGLLGDRIRLKYSSSGTYGGWTYLAVSAVLKD